MAITGKSGKKGKGSVAKREKSYKTKETVYISDPSFRRLARRAGVKRISKKCYPEMRSMTKAYLKRVLDQCVIYAEHKKRKTVVLNDVLYALKRVGCKLMGFQK
ncbi:Histone H4 [Cucumispora dikerogammari]|nr:Histone H4 [Cucumispora dikerogammari]